MSNFGLVVAPSSSKNIRIIANAGSAGTAIVGRSIFTVIELDDGEYMSMGTVTEITTHNREASNPMEQENAVRYFEEAEENRFNAQGINVRMADIALQATFRRGHGEKEWRQYGSSLPTSPSAHSKVKILEEEEIFELVRREEVCFVGYNYQSNVLSPFEPVRFSDSSGAVHSAYLAKSGSGKSVFASAQMAVNMRDHERAIIIVDPQGQWSSEHGFLYSPQAFAKAVGREVKIFRVSEDISLPREQTLIEQILTMSKMWKSFNKMAPETRELLSNDLARQLVYGYGDVDPFEMDAHELFKEYLRELEQSSPRLNEIYAGDKSIHRLRNRIRYLLHMNPLLIDFSEDPTWVSTEREKKMAERDLKKITDYFFPIHNLFSRVSINGNKRVPLTGYNGELENILKPRQGDDTPAPYVIIDMSKNTDDENKAEYARSATGDNAAVKLNELLGSDDVKTVILTHLFEEMTTVAEAAFNKGGNLNTEIVFDEAMRFAMPPNQASSEEAKEFTENLAEYARDTRKFGIGWTYILQTPTGLNENIFKQLTNLYVGWGLAGKDLQMIGEQMDGKEYLNIYSSFAPPRATGKYPFMLLGTNSPLIFTHTPSFVDSFTNMDEFFSHNSHWINELGTTYGRGTISLEDVSLETGQRLKALQRLENRAKKVEKKESKPLRIGNSPAEEGDKEKPAKKYEDWENITTDEDPPF